MLSSVRVMNVRCPGFALLVNSEVDSMGGVVDWGAGLDAKSLPRHAAILKAHEKLRLEYDVREEQRRELEFLEKGGNPLDYIFGHAASISRQSTSLTDQLAEQYVISEAKGSFALAASPHGHFVESSGRPGGSMGREPNIADNLLLFDGENSTPDRGKNVKRVGRRSNIGPLEQFSQIDGFCNTKESFSENFLLGRRGQAYARRNKSRSSRYSHSNRSPFLQSSCNDVRNCKVSKLEVHAEEQAISSNLNSRPASPNVKNLPKKFSSKNQLDMELDGGQTHHIHSDAEKAVYHVAEINSPEEVKNIDHNTAPVKQAATAQSSDLLVKEITALVGSLPVPPCAMDDNKFTNHDENNVRRTFGVDFMHAHDDNMVNDENVTDIIIELVGIKNVIIDPSCVSTSHLHGNSNGGESLSCRTVGSLDTKSKEHASCQGTSDDTCARENSQIACDPAHIANSEARNFEAKLNNSAVQFEDEMHLCDQTDDQAGKRPLSNIEIEISKESGISHDDSSFAVKAGLIVDNSIGNSHESSWPILSKKVSSNAPELQNREANQLKLSKKMHEDTMLKEARIIEVSFESLRSAGVLTANCISSEKRQKCHWDFVLEEMAWMANDFMQERLWKTTAAAKVCHEIASICSSKFEHKIFCKKQRNITRTLAKAVMKFWCSVDTIRTRGDACSDVNEHCDANLLKESNTSSFDTTEGQGVENCGLLLQPAIQRYALRLLQHISKMSNDPVSAEAPRTPDRINDAGTFGISCDDLSEEGLLYNVPPGAMHAYRESVESKWAHYKKMGNDLQEECGASACDSFRDHTKKRFEIHQLESNGSAGFYGQNVAKKRKLSNLAESPELMIPAGWSMPYPVASQMSNTSNSNTLIRIITNRDRRRKSKGLKMAYGQFGSGVPWSTFEDQALVVLVHDMGLNWELVTDALNSTLHFKCIYRKPKDCKERHRFLVDKSACDGADNAKGSGSPQPYPSTLPGIPKGSARQLFQRLQGPMEEDTLKSHFEKIIIIGQHLQYFQAEDVKQEQKQIAPAHDSHAFAVSQACPNNLPGTVLSPLDLCEAVNANPDALGAGYHGSHKSGNVIPGQQGSLTPAFPTATNTMLEGSTVVLGNILPSLSPPVNNTPPRDAQRHTVPRSATFPVDDQQRLQQYSQMFSSRKPQSCISIPGALAAGVDRSVGMLHRVNSMGMMCGVNKSMSISRAGFQGICPSGMFNVVSPNNILSSNAVAMRNPVATHSTSVSSPGNTTLRPRDTVQVLRPSQSTEEHRHSMMQEFQQQASLGNAQATTPFTGLSSSFSNEPISPVQHQLHQIPQRPLELGNPNHSNIQITNHSSTQQQAYIRFAKEKKLQQKIVPQAQQYPGSSTLPPMQNNYHFQQQCQSSSPVNSFVSVQPQHKQQPMPCNTQPSSTMSTKFLKQRRRQQIPQQQQQPRNLQQQKLQPQQQTKFVKDLGQGTMLLHHNLSVDASQVGVGGLPTGPNNQASEKHPMQKNQRLVSSSTGLNSNLQPLNQQKLYSRHPQQSMQVSVMSSDPDHNQASMQSLSSDAILATRKSDASTVLVTQKQQQLQENQSMTNMQRIMLQKNLQLNPDGRRQSTKSTNVPIKANQMIPSTSLPQISDSSSLPVVSSGVQWKLEPTFETCTLVEKTQLATLPCETFTGNDAVRLSSSQGLIQRQLSFNISIDGHGVDGHWQPQQLLQSQLPPQKQGVQGNLYAESSNTRPG